MQHTLFWTPLPCIVLLAYFLLRLDCHVVYAATVLVFAITKESWLIERKIYTLVTCKQDVISAVPVRVSPFLLWQGNGSKAAGMSSQAAVKQQEGMTIRLVSSACCRQNLGRT